MARTGPALESGEGRHRQTAGMLSDLQPVDASEDVLDRAGRLAQQGAFLDETRDDPLDECDLCVFEPLKTPTIEFQAQNVGLAVEGGIDHFEDAGFSCAPIAVHADGDRTGRMLLNNAMMQAAIDSLLRRSTRVSLSVRIILPP